MKNDILANIRAVAERVGAREGIEIVDVELLGGGGSRLVRIYIDRPGAPGTPDQPIGVTHGDCENVSHQVGTILDVEDIVPGGRYTLEVSSPGVERKLSRIQDFVRFAGQKAKIVLREPIESSKRWDGVLAGVTGDTIHLETSSGKRLDIPIEHVSKANLKFEW
jgi:ribosome maturation factor RimP